MKNLKLNQEVYFEDQNLPLKVLSMSERFAVCFREEDEKHYFLNLDFTRNIRNKEPFIFNRIDGDYQKFSDLELQELEEGKSEINKKNCRDLNIDWERTEDNLCDFCGVLSKSKNSNYCNACKHENLS